MVLKGSYTDFKGLPNGLNFILIDHCVGELLSNKVSSESGCAAILIIIPIVHVQLQIPTICGKIGSGLPHHSPPPPQPQPMCVVVGLSIDGCIMQRLYLDCGG